MKNKNSIRQKEILHMLQFQNKIDSKEVIKKLKISESTVRRLFIDMERNGLVIRTHGGIQLVSNVYSFDNSSKKYSDEKNRIGLAACSLIKENDVIFLDGGTTTLCFSIHLAKQIRDRIVKPPVIFTNSLANLEVLSSVAKINIIGGEYRPYRRDCYGYLAEQALCNLSFTKCFLGTDGFLIKSGFTATDFETAKLNELILKHSDYKVILCDSSKFSSSSLVIWAPLSLIDAVITDNNIDAAVRSAIISNNCTLITV